MNKRNEKTMQVSTIEEERLAATETKAQTTLNNDLFLRGKHPNIQTILVIEDDYTIGRLLMDIINEETPYRAFLASHGEQALQFVRSLKPDLFLLDYQLPHMNGLELYDTLHAMKGFTEIPALFMSVDAPIKELEKRHVCLMRKPFEIEDLLNTVKLLLSCTRMRCNMSSRAN